MAIREVFMVKRTGYYFIEVRNNEVIVQYRKLSEPDLFHVIRAKGEDIAYNFLEAVSLVDDLTPMDVAMIAYKLGIILPETISDCLKEAEFLISQIVQHMA